MGTSAMMWCLSICFCSEMMRGLPCFHNEMFWAHPGSAGRRSGSKGRRYVECICQKVHVRLDDQLMTSSASAASQKAS